MLGHDNKIIWNYLIYLVALFLNSPCFCSKGELLFVNTVWRHGARTPVYAFPSNPNNKKNVWKEGPGQLTQLGMQMQYDLGLYLRKRYRKFLSVDYHSSEIYIRSTDIDRTLMSAESNLAGLYPPEGYEKWNGTNTNWQPIPVHTVADDNEHLLRFPPGNCPHYKDVLSPLIDDSDVYKNFISTNQKFFDKISKLAGYEEGNLSNTWTVQDTFYCEKAHNITTVKWITDEMEDHMNDITGKTMGYMAGNVNDQLRTAVSKVGPGQLIKQIIKNLRHKAEGKITEKMIAYSAHDTTLAALLTALQVYNDIQPPFASCIIFELWKTPKKDNTSLYFLRAFYRNSTTSSPIKLNLYGKCIACKLQQFIDYSQPYTPDDVIYQCGLSPSYTIYWVGIGILSFLLIATWIGIIVCKCRKKRTTIPYSTHNSYEPLLKDESGRRRDSSDL